MIAAFDRGDLNPSADDETSQDDEFVPSLESVLEGESFRKTVVSTMTQLFQGAAPAGKPTLPRTPARWRDVA